MDISIKQYDNPQQLIAGILDIGEILLTSGAEVSRVEDTMLRIGKAYGFLRSDIFAINSSIVYSVTLDNGRIITQTRRILDSVDDMLKVEKINSLSRRICKKTLSVDELQKEINDIKQSKHYRPVVVALAYMIISGAFTLFYGGSIKDSIASLITGLVMYVVVTCGRVVHMQKMVQIILSSFLTGAFVALLIGLGLGESYDKIIIGNIMLLIPGKAFTNAFRDIIKGDMISGALGLLEAVLKALAIALGFALAIFIGGVM